jgi:hypothetical protein
LTINEAKHVYTPTREAAAGALPPEIANYLDGKNLLAKNQALRLSTINASGWPHAALLSVGEIIAMPSACLRFLMFAQSGTVTNLVRDTRLTLSLALGGEMHELWMRARPLELGDLKEPLAIFEAEIEKSRIHAAPYAALTSGITFSLHDADTVLPRWQRQLAALRMAR